MKKEKQRIAEDVVFPCLRKIHIIIVDDCKTKKDVVSLRANFKENPEDFTKACFENDYMSFRQKHKNIMLS